MARIFTGGHHTGELFSGRQQRLNLIQNFGFRLPSVQLVIEPETIFSNLPGIDRIGFAAFVKRMMNFARRLNKDGQPVLM